MKKFMKSLSAVVLALAVAISGVSVASAANSPTVAPEPVKQEEVKGEETITGLVPVVDTKENGTAKLSTIEETNKKWIDVPDKVVVDGITYKVTEISEGAFANCAKAKTVNVPKAITKFGKGAFTGCTAKKVIIEAKKAVTVDKKAFKGVDTSKMNIEVENMNKKELKKFEKNLKKAGFKGKVVLS